MRTMLFTCALWPDHFLRLDGLAWYLVPRDGWALARAPLLCPDQDVARGVDKEMVAPGVLESCSMPPSAVPWTAEELRERGIRLRLPGEGR